MDRERRERRRHPFARNYTTFASEIRRYPLTPLLRELSSRAWEAANQRFSTDESLDVVQEFTIAGIARVALQHGTDDRSWPRRTPSLKVLCSAYIDLPEPEVVDGSLDVSAILARMAHEQYPAQSMGPEAFGRLHALTADYLPQVANGPTPADWQSHLGVTLVDYWRIGWIMLAALGSNNGAIGWATLSAPHVAQLFSPLSADQVRSVITRRFAQSVPDAQAEARANVFQPSPKWSYSPLERRPLLDLGEDLAGPAPHFLMGQLTPTGLYYLGLDVFGKTFGQALGDAFEKYIGAQLDLLTHAQVHREITYGKDSRKSCDYIVVTAECVILVECKSGRPDLDARQGDSSTAMKKIEKAREQLETTANLIRTRHPNFAHIPRDRPFIGLVVTLEPHYVIETLSEDHLISEVLPIADATSNDVELLTAALARRSDLGERLRDRIFARPPMAPRPPRVQAAIEDLLETAPRNPIVGAGWDSLTDLPGIQILANQELASKTLNEPEPAETPEGPSLS